MNRKDLYLNQPDDRDIQNRFTAYVQEAVKNTLSTYYAKKITREEYETVLDEMDELLTADSEDDPEALLEFGWDMLENLSLWKALHNLTGRDITIIKLRILYDNSFREIGRVLGMTESAARQRYSRAIRILRENMEK